MNVLFTFYQVLTPIRAIMTANSAFSRLQQPGSPSSASSDIMPKLVFIACHGLFLAFVGSKLMQMGLLPTSSSDFLSLLPVKQV